jgi:hypothetical protein
VDEASSKRGHKIQVKESSDDPPTIDIKVPSNAGYKK